MIDDLKTHKYQDASSFFLFFFLCWVRNFSPILVKMKMFQ